MPSKQVILQKFGSVVRHQRELRGWSQERLAAECKLQRTYIGSVERGERNITLANILRIAQSLEIRASELLELVEAKL
ncbi:MAG: helix-turn-helix domain-containing protein [Planctomycetes bacterium]|nr:helix-turn-helix domain-containing protein [Planctomycetota bacterium]